MKCTIDHVLCLQLVNALDLSRMCIFVKSESVLISYHDVNMVFGLPDSGILTKHYSFLFQIINNALPG